VICKGSIGGCGERAMAERRSLEAETMPTCDYCGDEIEFRYVGGRSTPIHLSGRWCQGGRSDSGGGSGSTRLYSRFSSYLNPNAQCPVCGASVYFFQCPNGGRVFFDDVGWPWPKHGCTDTANRKRLSHELIQTPMGPNYFIGRDKKTYRIYEFDKSTFHVDFRLFGKEELRFKFFRKGSRSFFKARFRYQTLEKFGVTIDDIVNAPNFVVCKDKDKYGKKIVQFVCARLGRVIEMKMRV